LQSSGHKKKLDLQKNSFTVSFQTQIYSKNLSVSSSC